MTDDVCAVNKKPYHHGDLRRALIEGATMLLEEEGLEALSLRTVAKRAGVSTMAPYRHFADKAALLTAVAQHGFALLRDRLGEAIKGQAGREVIIALGVNYLRFASEHPDLYRLMFGRPPSWSGSEADNLALRPDTSFGIMAEQMRQIFPPDEAEMATLTTWSFIHGLASLVVDRRLSPFPEDVDALTLKVTAFFTHRFLKT